MPTIKKFFLLVLMLELLLSYTPAFAQTPVSPPTYSGPESQIQTYLCAPPDSGTVPSDLLFTCINKIYKFAIVVAAVIGVFFIVIAGYMYMSAEGNSESVDKAKDILRTTVTAIVILFAGYVLLKALNPDLVVLQSITPPVGNLPSASVTTAGLPPGITPLPPGGGNSAGGQCSDSPGLCTAQSSCGQNACPSYFQAIQNVATQISIPGVDSKKLLTAIMWHESRCTPSAQSNANPPACGLMQMQAVTANNFASQCGVTASVTCAWLEDPNNAQASVCLAAAYLQSLAQGACGTDIRNIAAGYDGGSVACGASANCSQDTSCSGQPMRKWECTFDDNAHTVCNTGYTETRNYVPDVVGCYNNQ